MAKGPIRKLKAKFIFPDDYNPSYANGAWGGLNPHGEIIAHFYHERLGLPYEQELEIGADGKAKHTTTVPDDHETVLVRYVVGGVTMDLDTAKRIHTWLGEKIDALETQLTKG